MFEWILKQIRKNNKGFTLVELVVVIAILGILAAIAVPRLSASRKGAAVAAHNANVKTIESAANMYIADGGGDVIKEGEGLVIEDSPIKNYLQEVPKVPKEAKKDNDEDVYKVKIVDGKITVTPGLRKIDDSGEVVEKKTTEQE